MEPLPPSEPRGRRQQLGWLLAILVVVTVMLVLRGRSSAADIAADILALGLVPLFYLAIRAEAAAGRG